MESIVYVGNAGSQNLSVFALASTGALRAIATVGVPGPDKPGASLPLAVSPDRRFVFAALRSPPYSVATFSIDAKTGALAYVGSGPLADDLAYIATDRTGRFLLGASYHGSTVTVNPIGDDGVAGGVQATLATLPNAHCIVTDPSNRYALHTSLGADVVHQKRFDAATGSLSPNDPPIMKIHTKAGPRHLTFSPDARFVYLVNELDGSLGVFPFDAATGTLKPEVQRASALPRGFTGTPWAADVHVSPDGRFLYASERTSSTLAGFRIEASDGTLTAIGTFPTAKQPRAFAIDPSSRYLLAAGELAGGITMHAIDPETGRLAMRANVPTGKAPSWVEIISLGQPRDD